MDVLVIKQMISFGQLCLKKGDKTLRQGQIIQKNTRKAVFNSGSEDVNVLTHSSIPTMYQVQLIGVMPKLQSLHLCLCLNPCSIEIVHRSQLQIYRYLCQLEDLHIPHSQQTLKTCDKSALVKAIWRRHKHQKSVRFSILFFLMCQII